MRPRGLNNCLTSGTCRASRGVTLKFRAVPLPHLEPEWHLNGRYEGHISHISHIQSGRCVALMQMALDLRVLHNKLQHSTDTVYDEDKTFKGSCHTSPCDSDRTFEGSCHIHKPLPPKRTRTACADQNESWLDNNAPEPELLHTAYSHVPVRLCGTSSSSSCVAFIISTTLAQKLSPC